MQNGIDSAAALGVSVCQTDSGAKFSSCFGMVFCLPFFSGCAIHTS
jgi:hypothetical protein